MKFKTILTTIFLLSNLSLIGQPRTIQGRVISEDLEPLPGVRILGRDTILLGETDLYGRFKMNIPPNIETLSLSWVGMEWTSIKLKPNCDTLEIITFYDAIYHFRSSKKVDRLRSRQFKKLPKLHLQAYNQGLFDKKAICYSRDFEPYKPRLDEIGREMRKKEIAIKQFFKKVIVGDTIAIPFSEEYRHNKADTTNLGLYSAFVGKVSSTCITKGIVLDKHKKHRGYNLVYQVIDCGHCRPSSLYDGKAIKIGAIFEYNMRNFKVLIE